MITEGHDVEKATERVDAMQSSRVGAAYLALTVAPATEHAQIVHGLLNETVPFLVPVPYLIIRPGQISRDCTIILGLKLPKSNNNSACSRRFFKSVKFLNQALNGQFYASITVKKAYKLHAKDNGKEVHIGDGEKGVAHSYLGVDLSKHFYTLGQICIV